MLEHLTRYFAWRDDGTLTAAMEATLVDASSARYAHLVQRLATRDPARADALGKAFGALPDDAFLRVLLAPETGYRLGYDPGDALTETADYLETAIAVEAAILGQAPVPAKPAWSARGDHYFPGEAGAIVAARTDDVFDPRRPYVAPALHGMIVDASSPRAVGKLVHIAGQAAPIAPAHLAAALDRIDAALAVVRETDAAAWRTLTGLTDVIVVRSDPSVPEHYTSASTTLCLRRPVLRNPFVAAARVCDLADGLVHEAIHCACDISEMVDGPWLNDASAYGTYVFSPWTGRRLDLHTYLQACWVWYGLWNFWLAALEEGTIAPDDAAYCLARAYRGFYGALAVDRLLAATPWIAPRLLAALASAQAAVLAQADALPIGRTPSAQ